MNFSDYCTDICTSNLYVAQPNCDPGHNPDYIDQIAKHDLIRGLGTGLGSGYPPIYPIHGRLY